MNPNTRTIDDRGVTGDGKEHERKTTIDEINDSNGTDTCTVLIVTVYYVYRFNLFRLQRFIIIILNCVRACRRRRGRNLSATIANTNPTPRATLLGDGLLLYLT
jgi:hypothetical protein